MHHIGVGQSAVAGAEPARQLDGVELVERRRVGGQLKGSDGHHIQGAGPVRDDHHDRSHDRSEASEKGRVTSPIDRLLGAIVNPVVGAVDVGEVIGQVDMDQVVSEIDVNSVVDRVDIEKLMAQANIDSIVRDASRGVFARGIDAVRRQVVGLDAILVGAINRLFRRPRMDSAVAQSGTMTGQTAGGVSRLAAFFLDGAVLAAAFAVTTAVVAYLTRLFFNEATDISAPGLLVFGGYSIFSFLYFWIGLSITGRSIGKGVVGLKVVARNGTPITPGRAFVRQLVYPISFILGLGLIPIVLGKNRRALHDWAGRDKVLYDWGDRPAELPAPLTAWVRQRSETPAVPGGAS